MVIQQTLCRNCIKPIEEIKRKDSIFCSEECRKQNWELSGKRHSRIPTKASYDDFDVLKASETKQNEVKTNVNTNEKILSKIEVWG